MCVEPAGWLQRIPHCHLFRPKFHLFLPAGDGLGDVGSVVIAVILDVVKLTS